MRTITAQYMVGQLHVGEEFTTRDDDGQEVRVRVLEVRSVVRGTDEVELEVLEPGP